MPLPPVGIAHARALERIRQARDTLRPWSGLPGIPWSDPGFSDRMLEVHLDPDTDRGTRRPAVVAAHVDWLLDVLRARGPQSTGPWHILDAGCGPGLYAHELARRGHRCTGLDCAPAALRHARAVAESEGLGCSFQEADLANLPPDLPALVAPAASLDAVTWWFGDFHGFAAAQIPDIFKRLAACLRPGGLFILEYQPLADFVTEGGSTWDLVDGSPFCDRPHLWLQDFSWHADVRTELHAHWILEIGSGTLHEYFQCHQGWEDRDLDAMLAGCGLAEPVRHEPITGVDPELEFPLIVTRRRIEERDHGTA